MMFKAIYGLMVLKDERYAVKVKIIMQTTLFVTYLIHNIYILMWFQLKIYNMRVIWPKGF